MNEAEALTYVHNSWTEVQEFLGAAFDPDLCHGDDRKVLNSFASYLTPAEFYAKTDVYIYHSVGYFLEGVKRPYYARLFDELPHGRASIIDYGCGGGDDGLMFYQAGLIVSWADVPSRAFEFLRWRADRHVNAALAYVIGKDNIPQHDYAWCMDVLEHIEPARHREFIEYLTRVGRRVFVNLVNDPAAAAGALHNPVDVAGLTQWALGRWPGEYHDYYGGRVRLLMLGEKITMETTAGEEGRVV